MPELSWPDPESVYRDNDLIQKSELVEHLDCIKERFLSPRRDHDKVEATPARHRAGSDLQPDRPVRGGGAC